MGEDYKLKEQNKINILIKFLTWPNR